jgi:hypothetical protein
MFWAAKTFADVLNAISKDAAMAVIKSIYQNVTQAYRQRLPWGGDESPGRNNSERKVASKVRSPEGRAPNRRAKAAWGAEI